LVEAGTIDTDGIRHSAKVAWRALANLEKELEAELCAEKTPGEQLMEELRKARNHVGRPCEDCTTPRLCAFTKRCQRR
jgi:hypothetical protein